MEVLVALGEPSYEQFLERTGRPKPKPPPDREDVTRVASATERMIRGF